jgi:hypothetical protein
MSAARRRFTPSPWGAVLLVAVLCLGLVVAGRVAFVGAVYFDDATTDAGFTADILDLASNLDGSVLGLGQITLDWTATPDTYATGYRVMRSKDSSPFLEVATVTPRTNTTYSDNLGILGAGTYRYYVIAYYESWNSVASNTIACTHATLLTLCP